jgi:hypothetical protein
MGWIILTGRAVLSREMKEHEHRNRATRIKTQAAPSQRWSAWGLPPVSLVVAPHRLQAAPVHYGRDAAVCPAEGCRAVEVGKIHCVSRMAAFGVV